MTDRELLELAAKAAGMEIILWDFGFVPHLRYKYDHQSFAWNPLNNNGDALLLAVECRISIEFDHIGDAVLAGESSREKYVDSNYCISTATRRAITRAAAAIQLSKEGK